MMSDMTWAREVITPLAFLALSSISAIRARAVSRKRADSTRDEKKARSLMAAEKDSHSAEESPAWLTRFLRNMISAGVMVLLRSTR